MFHALAMALAVLALASATPLAAPADLLARGVPCWDTPDDYSDAPPYAALAPRQQFSYDNASGVFSLVANDSLCLTASAAVRNVGTPLRLAACGGDAALAAGQSWDAVGGKLTPRNSTHNANSAGFRSGAYRTNLEVWVYSAGNAITFDTNSSVLRVAPSSAFNKVITSHAHPPPPPLSPTTTWR